MSLHDELLETWVYDRDRKHDYYHLHHASGGFSLYTDATSSAIFEMDPDWKKYETPVITVFVLWQDEHYLRVIVQDPNEFFLPNFLFGAIGTICTEGDNSYWINKAVSLPEQRARYIRKLVPRS